LQDILGGLLHKWYVIGAELGVLKNENYLNAHQANQQIMAV